MIRRRGMYIRALCMAALTALLLAAAGATAIAEEEKNWPVSKGAKEAEAKARNARNKAGIGGICGPDITSNVMDVLGRIYKRFLGMNRAQKQKKCNAMFSLSPAGWGPRHRTMPFAVIGHSGSSNLRRTAVLGATGSGSQSRRPPRLTLPVWPMASQVVPASPWMEHLTAISAGRRGWRRRRTGVSC